MARKTIERGISYDETRQKYYVYMDSGKDEQGKRRRTYRTYPTLTQARKARLTFQTERLAHSSVAPLSMTLSQWLTRWMDEIVRPSRAATTIYGYTKIIENHLVPALGEVPIQQLAPAQIQRYYTMLLREKGLSPNTIRRHHDLLSSSLRAALRLDMLSRCPTERVEPPRVIPKEARYYSPEDLKRLYAAVEGHWLELPVRLAGCLGLRREEICGLKWSCVDFERRRIHIQAARTCAGGTVIQKETKNRSSNRVLLLTDELAPLLRREYLRQQQERQRMGAGWPDTDLLLVNPDGRPYSPDSVTRSFRRFILTRQLPGITLHGLRHTFATVASAQGAPLFEIGRALGHSTPATTGRIYTHLLDTTHSATLLRVAAALK